MSIGTFGKCVFSTSDNRILTFKNLSYRTSSRSVVHEIMGCKPKTEYIGPGLDEVTFTIVLRAELGIDVQKELEQWREMVRTGAVERLIVGKRPLGSGRWMVTDCSEAWNVVNNQGSILSASLDISLREYL